VRELRGAVNETCAESSRRPQRVEPPRAIPGGRQTRERQGCRSCSARPVRPSAAQSGPAPPRVAQRRPEWPSAANPHWSPGRQKSRRVDFSHRRCAAALTLNERKLQCSSSFRRSRLLRAPSFEDRFNRPEAGKRSGAMDGPRREESSPQAAGLEARFSSGRRPASEAGPWMARCA
jgi:hypothetical protein